MKKEKSCMECEHCIRTDKYLYKCNLGYVSTPSVEKLCPLFSWTDKGLCKQCKYRGNKCVAPSINRGECGGYDEDI